MHFRKWDLVAIKISFPNYLFAHELAITFPTTELKQSAFIWHDNKLFKLTV